MKIKNGNLVLDELDIQILRLLSENAKLTYTEMGRHLNVAHSTVYERIKKLEKHGVIEKYTIIVNKNKIGRRFLTAIMTIYTDPKETENVAKKLAEYENILEVSNSLSEELLIIAKVVAEDQEKLHSFIANSVAPLPGVLRVRTSIITKKYKEKIFLPI